MVVPMSIPSHDCANLSCTSACGKLSSHGIMLVV